jgi:hypothetical protein
MRKRSDNNEVKNDSPGGELLLQFQKFLSRLEFFSCPRNDRLRNHPELILHYAVFADCPLQQNPFDCSLFAVAVVLHLAYGVPVVHDVFTQQHITKFRSGLHRHFTTNESLTLHLVFSYFSHLCSRSRLSASPTNPLTGSCASF